MFADNVSMYIYIYACTWIGLLIYTHVYVYKQGIACTCLEAEYFVLSLWANAHKVTATIKLHGRKGTNAK